MLDGDTAARVAGELTGSGVGEAGTAVLQCRASDPDTVRVAVMAAVANLDTRTAGESFV